MLPTEKHTNLVPDRLCGLKDIVHIQHPMELWYSLCHIDPDLPWGLVSKEQHQHVSIIWLNQPQQNSAQNWVTASCYRPPASWPSQMLEWIGITCQKACIFTWYLLHRWYHVNVLANCRIFTVLGMNIMPFKIIPPNVPVKWVAVSNVLYLGGPRFQHQPREHLT